MLDVSLNNTMRIITGCVKPTPIHLLPVLSGIAPAKLRRNYVTNKISHHAWVNKEQPLHSLVPDLQSLRPQRLKSRHPFYRHAAEHHNCDHDIIEAWNEEWTKHQRPKQLTITPDTTAPPGSDLPRKLWVILNRLRAGAVWRRNVQMGTQNISLMCVRSCYPKCGAHLVRLQSPSFT